LRDERRTADVRTVNLKVPTIKCEGCVEEIRETLTKRSGVAGVEGDPARKDISVTFDPDRLADADIRAVVADPGFAVR